MVLTDIHQKSLKLPQPHSFNHSVKDGKDYGKQTPKDFHAKDDSSLAVNRLYFYTTLIPCFI